MRNFALHSPVILCALVVLFGAMASLVPVSPVEPVLVGVAAVAPPWLLVPLVVLATVSHMATKTLVFIGGRKVEQAFSTRNRARFEWIRARLSGSEALQLSTLFVSSVTGLPPFYVITALCGTLRMPLRHFLMVATTGRAIRFAILVFLPQLLRAQHSVSTETPSAVRVTGEGRDTYVLVSGMLGGAAGYRRIEALLVEQGNRVISIDPYHLSLDSLDVSFDALARRVDAELRARDVANAVVVGHSHGGGVALRLVANAPQRARELVLLDVGALAIQRSTVFGSSIRFVPFITPLPKGKSFVRSRLMNGLRANSGRADWLDDATMHWYTEPILANIASVAKMAMRLADTKEPEALANVVARVRVPVTLLLAELKLPSSPGVEEIVALEPLGSRVRIHRIPGAGHFVHEEAPHIVVAHLGSLRSGFADRSARGAP